MIQLKLKERVQHIYDADEQIPGELAGSLIVLAVNYGHFSGKHCKIYKQKDDYVKNKSSGTKCQKALKITFFRRT